MDARYICRDPEVMSGALCFKGTRVPVQNLFDYLEGTSSLEEFLQDFPSVSREAAVAVIEGQRAGCLQMRLLLDESVSGAFQRTQRTTVTRSFPGEQALGSLQPCTFMRVGA